MQWINNRVVKKVNELVKDSVTSVTEMESWASRLLHKKWNFMIVLPLPDPGNHRFFPSRNDIYNIMYRASIQMRHSKIDQEKLAHKIAEWLQESLPPPPPTKINSFCDQVWSLHQTFLSQHKKEGGVRGVWIPQNRTEIRINTAQNNIRKPQTTLKLPKNF